MASFLSSACTSIAASASISTCFFQCHRQAAGCIGLRRVVSGGGWMCLGGRNYFVWPTQAKLNRLTISRWRIAATARNCGVSFGRTKLLLTCSANGEITRKKKLSKRLTPFFRKLVFGVARSDHRPHNDDVSRKGVTSTRFSSCFESWSRRASSAATSSFLALLFLSSAARLAFRS